MGWLRRLDALGHDLVVVERAAGVEAAAFGHVRRGDLLLERLVDEAAVLGVDEARPEDHGRAYDGTAAATLGQADGHVGGQEQEGQGDEDDGDGRPEGVGVPLAVAHRGDAAELLVVVVLAAPGGLDLVVAAAAVALAVVQLEGRTDS